MDRIWDVIIVGGGPGGLQAGIAAASEGLQVLLLEKGQIGGQIGQTPLLENSVFAQGGITGPAFAAMMKHQALSMGVTIEAGEAIKLFARPANKAPLSLRVKFHAGADRAIRGHTVVLAMGNRWRELDITGLGYAVKRGLAHFGPVKSIGYQGQYPKPGHRADVAVYGGGPAAGQAILALADNSTVNIVHALMRSTLNMPEYLAERIRQHPMVSVHEQTEIAGVRVNADSVLLTLAGNGGTLDVERLWLCNGLLPATGWVNDTLALDSTGRILTHDNSLETQSMPGVFAIGDCRAGSTPRVGVAIGDGSMAVTEIWTYFRQHPVCRICPKLIGKPERAKAV